MPRHRRHLSVGHHMCNGLTRESGYQGEVVVKPFPAVWVRAAHRLLSRTLFSYRHAVAGRYLRRHDELRALPATRQPRDRPSAL